MVKVSIIVPVYNAENGIRKCLDSLRKQEMADFECILVNDGSTDSSGHICDEYANIDSRFHVIHKKNMGASEARNTGIKESSGEWIVFVDSDDWVSPTYISSFFDGEEADLIFQGIIKETGNKSKQIKFDCFPNHDFIENLYYIERKDLLGWTFNKMFKANIIKGNDIRFPSNITLREDLIFTLQYIQHSKSITWRNNTTYHYIETPGSLMTRLKTYGELATGNELLYHLRCQILQNYPLEKYKIWTENQYFNYKITIIRYAFYRKYRLSRELRYNIIKEATAIKTVNIHNLGKTDQIIYKIVKSCIPMLIKDTLINFISQSHGRKHYKGQA